MAPLLLTEKKTSAIPEPDEKGRPVPEPAERKQPALEVLRPAHDKFRTERILSLTIIAIAALYLRVLNPHFSTAYMDESIYVIYGRMFLTRHFESPLNNPLQWSFGWYLWPCMAAAADWLGGLAALREMAAALGMLTIAAVYGFARRMFAPAVGIGAAAVMAVLAPAVLVSRIATRDSGSICFFALGLWAFACAWQENRKRHWLLAGILFFAAFLCKYLLAIYFPLLVIVALFKGRKPFFLFALPLFAACCFYGWFYATDLQHLLHYGSAYNSLKAPTPQAWNIYLWERMDFWILVLLAIPALLFRQYRGRAAVFAAGMLPILFFQWQSRADYDYWKHVNYALLFVVPLAVAGLVLLTRHLQKNNYAGQMFWGASSALVLAAGIALVGEGQSVEHFVFWPNVEPVVAYFDSHLTPNDRVLVDDTVLRYYFQPTLHQAQITDPMYFHYGELFGDQAYKAGVRDGVFNYIVLDGGIGEEARRMAADIRPFLGGYVLKMSTIEPTLGHTIEIYAKAGSEVEVTKIPDIRLVSPPNNGLVPDINAATTAEGVVNGAGAGWYVELEVFTNRWYSQADKIPIAPDGTFQHAVYLRGIGRQRCSHLIRARLFDEAGRTRATTFNYGIARAASRESCPTP